MFTNLPAGHDSHADEPLADAKLPDSRLLPFAVRFVVQRLYISATNAERQWKSPYEIIHGKPPIIKIEDLPKFWYRGVFRAANGFLKAGNTVVVVVGPWYMR